MADLDHSMRTRGLQLWQTSILCFVGCVDAAIGFLNTTIGCLSSACGRLNMLAVCLGTSIACVVTLISCLDIWLSGTNQGHLGHYSRPSGLRRLESSSRAALAGQQGQAGRMLTYWDH